jgi:hypothetical protein
MSPPISVDYADTPGWKVQLGDSIYRGESELCKKVGCLDTDISPFKTDQCSHHQRHIFDLEKDNANYLKENTRLQESCRQLKSYIDGQKQSYTVPIVSMLPDNSQHHQIAIENQQNPIAIANQQNPIAIANQHKESTVEQYSGFEEFWSIPGQIFDPKIWKGSWLEKPMALLRVALLTGMWGFGITYTILGFNFLLKTYTEQMEDKRNKKRLDEKRIRQIEEYKEQEEIRLIEANRKKSIFERIRGGSLLPNKSIIFYLAIATASLNTSTRTTRMLPQNQTPIIQQRYRNENNNENNNSVTIKAGNHMLTFKRNKKEMEEFIESVTLNEESGIERQSQTPKKKKVFKRSTRTKTLADLPPLRKEELGEEFEYEEIVSEIVQQSPYRIQVK